MRLAMKKIYSGRLIQLDHLLLQHPAFETLTGWAVKLAKSFALPLATTIESIFGASFILANGLAVFRRFDLPPFAAHPKRGINGEIISGFCS
jgi:hypothetical protein